MPNKRDPNKIRVQTWVSKEDKKALEALAKEKGYSNLADFLTAVARGIINLMLMTSLVRYPMKNSTAPAVVQQRLVSPRVGEQIAEELNRASNIIASYYEKHKSEMPANVACALTREMMRLRDLAARVMPALQEEGEEGQQSNIQTLKTSHPNGTQAMSTPKEPIPSPASVPFGIWQPFATAPRDRPILVTWGTVASGAIGWDIVKHKYDDKWKSENSDDILPEGGYSAIAWMPLPPLPNDATTTKP